MIIKPENYSRKAFNVKAIDVTPENIEAVAEWCGGEVRTANPAVDDFRSSSERYIVVPVKKPLNERQTRAYYGDWVLLATTSTGQNEPAGFKVYTPRAFETSFDKQVENMIDVIERMDARARAEERAESQDEVINYPELTGSARTAFSDQLR